jgi:endonuclease-3 related protein
VQLRPGRGRIVREAFDRLLTRLGPQHWWPGETPFEVVVGALLTQNTAWRNVERAIAALERAGALSAEGIAALDEERLAELVRPSGYYRQKAARLKGLVAFIEGEGGLEALLARPAPELREALLSVKGVGPETADSIVLYAAGKPAFVVDAYTRRIASRLGLCQPDASYDELQRLFASSLPEDVPLFNEYHALLVALGKDVCLKREPRCDGCPLAELCPFPRSRPSSARALAGAGRGRRGPRAAPGARASEEP